MLIKSILNRIQPQRGFVYGNVRWREHRSRLALDIEISPRLGSRPICSGCHRRGPGYDTLARRSFEFIPLWGIAVFFLYAMRRVDCPRCGVKVELIPWAQGKNHLTTTYAWFLARWARRLSWKEVGEAFYTSWDNVFRSVKMAVSWGLAHRTVEDVTAIGIDEIAYKKRHKYLTMVYQIDDGCRRLLWIGKDRTQKTLRQFFSEFGKERTAQLQFICSDMWKPYLRIIAKEAGHALNILDRFHIMSQMNKALDKVRAQETRALKAKGEQPILAKSRWCILKRPDKLTEKQSVKLKELLACNLKTIRAYLLKEDFQRFWQYKRAAWAEKFLDEWCKRTMRSRLLPMKKVAKMLRAHRGLLLNWFRAREKIALGAVEGLNNKGGFLIKDCRENISISIDELLDLHRYTYTPKTENPPEWGLDLVKILSDENKWREYNTWYNKKKEKIGKFLEFAVFHAVKNKLEERERFNYRILHSVKPKRFDISKEFQKNFELDVVLLLGYQLVVISCTTQDHEREIKLKAMEATHRAQQIGGDEAKTIVVCGALKEQDKKENLISKKIKKELFIDTGQKDLEGRIDIWGRETWSDLEGKFEKYFKDNLKW